MIETGVLVVGCGPAGLTAALALARHGVRVLAISKHAQLAPTPRAHVTNQRTFEVFRDLGVEAEARRFATGYDRMPYASFLRTLTGPEFGRIRGLGQEASAGEVSPCTLADLSQNLLEPVLLQAALRAGAKVRFSTELVSFEQEDGRVLAEVTDRLSGDTLTIAATYMIGADGGNSRVAQLLDLPFEGEGAIGQSLNILFHCDLTQHVAHRPGLLFFLLRTAQDDGGIGLGILRCIQPWTKWLLIKGFDPGSETLDLPMDKAAAVIRDYLGLPDLEPEVTGIDPWTMNSLYATRYQDRRVFCIGDAVHRHVPSNGLGSNTAVQDAYNLAWKLAYVLKGLAEPSLLDTYSEERVPVGKEVVEHSTNTMALFPALLDAVGILDASTSSELAALWTAIDAPSEAGKARRARIRAAIEDMVYEVQTRGLELNQFYRSRATITDGEPKDLPSHPDLTPYVTTLPGAHLPHAWVQREGMQVSTLDLVGADRFTVLTGVGGYAWLAAAEQVGAEFGMEIAAVAIGPGCTVTDLLFEWQSLREIDEDGCLLVRPDGYVAWRQTASNSHHAMLLANALRQILGKQTAVQSRNTLLRLDESPH